MANLATVSSAVVFLAALINSPEMANCETNLTAQLYNVGADIDHAGHTNVVQSLPSYGVGGPYYGGGPQRPYRHDAFPKQGCPIKPCCTFGFDEVEDYSSGHWRKKFVPLTDAQLLPVGQCPHKSDEELCRLASERFATPGSRYVPKRDYNPHGFDKPGYLPEDALLEYAKRHRDARDSHGTVARVVDPLIVYDKWVSDTFSDLVIINNNCCFNIFPAVKPGDYLETKCENHFFSDAEELTQNFKYNILTPGITRIKSTGAVTLDSGVISLGGLYGELGDTFVANSNPFTSTPPADLDFAYASLFAFINAGEFDASGDSSVVGPEGDEAVFDPDASERSEEFFDEARQKVSAQVCALGRIISQLEPNGEGTIVSSANQVTLDCGDVTDEVCVINLTSARLEDIRNFMVNFGTETQDIYVNVLGKEPVRMVVDSFELGMPTNAVTFNFKSDTVNLSVNTESTFNILAPHANVLDFATTADELSVSILMGNANSTLNYYLVDAGGAAVSVSPPDDLDDGDFEGPTVTLCTCVCEDKECKWGPV